MYLITHNETVVWRVIDIAPDGSYATRSAEDAIAEAAEHTGLPAGELQAWPVPAGQEDIYRAAGPETMSVRLDDQGQVTSVELPTTLYLHVTISGHSGEYLGVPLFAPGDAMGVQVALRSGNDPDSPVVPISGTWPIPVLAADGSEYDRVFVTTTDGQAGFTYTIPDRTGRCALSEQGMDRIEYGGAVYQIRLAQPVTFYVGRAVTTAA